MILNFTVTEDDVLAFTQRYLRDSKSHQNIRARVRWSLPIIMIAMVCYYSWRDGLSWTALVIFGGIALLWWLLYPRRFDARIRELAKKQMKESSYAKSFGRYEVVLFDQHLRSTSPTGSSTYVWSAVDRVEMDPEYLYIFLSGPLGYPIRLSEIGREAAQSAFEFISSRFAGSRRSEQSRPDDRSA
jgi:hypothetical protein